MNRRNFFNTAAFSAVAAASVSKVAMAGLPEVALMTSTDTAAPLSPPQWPALQPGRHPEWLDAALAHEQRCQRISLGGRTRGA